MNLFVRLLILAALAGGIIALVTFLQAAPSDAAQVIESQWTDSSQCMECHQDVWDEWHGSHHQIAYTNPEVRKLSNDFRNKECQTCHLPRPIFETGIKQRPLPRSSTPLDGVSCLTCHLAPDGGIYGRHDMPEAPCNPVRSDAFLSVDLCATCHNQHFTTDQYRASEWPSRDVSCNSCHMPEVTRTNGSAGYHHGFPGAHDDSMLRRAATVAATLPGEGTPRELVVTVANVGAGHNFPTEERHRAVDVEWRARTDDGEPGPWNRLHRFRMYYIDEGGRDDQLHAHDTWQGTAELPKGTISVELAVWYRFQPFATNDSHQSVQLWTTELSAGQRDWASPPEAPFAARAIDRTDQPEGFEGTANEKPPIDEFEALIQAAPAAPDDAAMAQLTDLRDTAFAGESGERIARLSKRSLLDEDAAFWALEDGLKHESSAIAANCAFELGSIGAAASLDPLLLRLKYELDPGDLPWVVMALHRLGNDSGLIRLVDMMQAEATAQASGQVAVQILQGPVLEALGAELSEAPTYVELSDMLRQLDQRWRRTGTGVLADPPATELDGMDPLLKGRLASRLIELTGTKLRPVDDCRFVFNRLGATGLPMLQLGLRSKSLYIRVHSLEIIGVLGPVAAPLADDVMPLLGAPLTATKAAHALGAIGAIQAAPELRRWLALPAEGTESVTAATVREYRIAAAEALGPMGDTDSIGDLRALVDDAQTPVDLAIHAAFSLGWLENGGAGREFLVAQLESDGAHKSTVAELLDRLDADLADR